MLVAMGVPSVLVCHQVLIKHLLVANLIVHLVFKLELYAIEADHLLIIVAVVIEAVHLLVDHLHNLIFVETVEVRGVPPNDPHLAIGEVLVANDILQARDIVTATATALT